MGIPAFYRWLAERYSRAVSDVVVESPSCINGVELPIDSSTPNPNGFEFDNLYLDMNGIIHPCFHPEGQPAPKSYEEVFKAVFKYIDHLFTLVRPRKLLFMAIDGVAPRAKMNQQRTRRFRAAKDAADAAAGEEALRKVFESEGEKLSSSLDSNVITPGTEFMDSLSRALQYYVHLRMNTDPGWRGIKVILSDANVVGEGEHKIMSYIRLQRNLKGFDPNTRHCLYGLDADLIMLALATHEIHFSILREVVNQRHTKSAEMEKDSAQKDQLDIDEYISKQQFQFFNIWVLRDYLMHDMNIPNSEVEVDLERLLDDFIFMCLLVGNDFLPHVPSLEISEGAIDLLMTVYKQRFVEMGGYLTDSYKVNMKRVECFIQAVGSNEDAIFKRRRQKEKGFALGSSNAKRGCEAKRSGPPKEKKSKTFWSSMDLTQNSSQSLPSVKSCAKGTQSSFTGEVLDGPFKIVDDIQLGEEGWKVRYYTQKFEVKTEAEREEIRKHAVLKYIEGMCWVMHYYYEGVCSWQWFYPYHYAPFASDFYDLEHCKIHFTPGEPFKPFNQLMAVLPAASAHALPLSYRELMTESSSPISDFYPADFELDMNGKRHEWQAICKLPFIEESRLLAEIAKVEHTLTDEEKRRNSFGMDVLFLHISHPLSPDIVIFYEKNKDHPKLAMAKVKRSINPKLSGGMNGVMYVSDRPVWPPEICSPVGDMEKVATNKVVSLFYRCPDSHPHIPRPPKGVVMPRVSIRKGDILQAALLWHEQSAIFGRIHSGRPVPKSISGARLSMLAHQLVVKCCLERKEEIVEPAVVNGLVAIDDSQCVTQSNSEVTVKEKIADDVSCTTITRLEKGSALAVAGMQTGKEKSTCTAASEKGQPNGDLSVFDKHIAINSPIAPIQGSSDTPKPMNITRDVSTGSGKKKWKRKRISAAVCDTRTPKKIKNDDSTGSGKKKWVRRKENNAVSDTPTPKKIKGEVVSTGAGKRKLTQTKGSAVTQKEGGGVSKSARRRRRKKELASLNLPKGGVDVEHY